MAGVDSAGNAVTPFTHFVGNLKKWSGEFQSSVRCYIYCNGVTSHEERFKIVDQFLQQQSALAAIKIGGRDPNGKSEREAVDARWRGNQLFAEKRWQKSLVEYNQSLRFAPVSDPKDGPSLALALAYGNRSAVYFKQGRYLECILDIELAVKHGYPQDKIVKLVRRKAETFLATQHYAKAVSCLEEWLFADLEEPLMPGPRKKERMELETMLLAAKEVLENQQVVCMVSKAPAMRYYRPNGPAYLEKATSFGLAGGQNKDLPGASALLRISHSSEHGQHFVCAREIDAGDVLLKDPAFVTAVMDCSSESNCLACSVWTDNPTYCKTCTNVVFCSLDCACGVKAKVHAKECSLLWSLRGGTQEQMDSRFVGLRGLLTCVYRVFLMKSLDDWSLLAEAERAERPDKEFEEILNSHFPEGYWEIYHLPETKFGSTDEQIMCGFGAWFVVTLLENTDGYRGMDAKMWDFFGRMAVQHLSSFSWNMLWATELVVKVPGSVYAGVQSVSLRLHPSVRFVANSCAPNATGAFFGDTLILRAIRPIKKDEAVTMYKLKPINFVNLFEEERRYGSVLTNGSSHVCSCKACQENGPRLMDIILLKDPNVPWKVKCDECGHRFEVTPNKIRYGEGKCGQCGSPAVPCLSRLERFKHESQWRILRSEDDIAPLFELSREASRYLVEPNNMLSLLYYVLIPPLWGYQGNKKLVFEDV